MFFEWWGPARKFSAAGGPGTPFLGPRWKTFKTHLSKVGSIPTPLKRSWCEAPTALGERAPSTTPSQHYSYAPPPGRPWGAAVAGVLVGPTQNTEDMPVERLDDPERWDAEGPSRPSAAVAVSVSPARVPARGRPVSPPGAPPPSPTRNRNSA